jgi:hypothetical protein
MKQISSQRPRVGSWVGLVKVEADMDSLDVRGEYSVTSNLLQTVDRGWITDGDRSYR